MAPRSTRGRRVEFLGTPIDLLTMAETIEIAAGAMRRGERVQHGLVNVAKLVNMRRNRELYHDVAGSDVINIDGVGILWGIRLLTEHAPERVAGIDLMMNLLALCEREGFRPYFIGARPEVVEAAVAAAKRRHPRLQFAGYQHGYFSAEEEPAVMEAIRRSRADCLFVGISSPTKERLLRQYRDSLDVPFLMGVGGSFDVLAGRVRRAPPWMQRAGLEWLHRMIMDPRRLTRRYVVTNAIYAGLLLQELARSFGHRYWPKFGHPRQPS